MGGLSHDIAEANFHSFFEGFGPVVDSVIMYDFVSRKPRGFGFVTYRDGRDAEDAARDTAGGHPPHR